MEHHPDYDEIDRLERELFPEWFEQEKPAEKPKPIESAPVAEYHGHSTEARKNPNWKPSLAVLLDKQPEFVWPAGSAVIASSTALGYVDISRDNHYGPRLRRVGE